MEHWRSGALHALAPEVVIWECDFLVYRAGWLQEGIVGPAQLGTAGYLHEIPERKILTEYWNLLWEGRIPEAIAHSRRVAARHDHLRRRCAGTAPTPAGPTTSPTGARRTAARRRRSGCPMGDYPHSRPPQGILPDERRPDPRRPRSGRPRGQGPPEPSRHRQPSAPSDPHTPTCVSGGGLYNVG